MDLSKIEILKGNEIYRVHDILNFPKGYGITKELLENPIYKDTIMYNYFQKTTNENKDLNLLYEVLKEYQEKNSIQLYDDSYVLLHVRTGDDFRNRGLMNLGNIKFYLDSLVEYPDKKIVLVTAMHYGNKENSKYYRGEKNLYREDSYNKNIELLNNFIEQLPREAELCSNSNIDIDFVKLVMCKNLIAREQAGGFAKIIIQLNKIHNALEG
jgi:hypothetical protein